MTMMIPATSNRELTAMRRRLECTQQRHSWWGTPGLGAWCWLGVACGDGFALGASMALPSSTTARAS